MTGTGGRLRQLARHSFVYGLGGLVSKLVGIALVAAIPSAPALAQQAAAISLGMRVTDASGGVVGTVSGLNGDNVMLKTDKHDVLLPKSSFTASNGKLLFGMTQAQLNAEIEKSTAAASSASQSSGLPSTTHTASIPPSTCASSSPSRASRSGIPAALR